MKEQKFEALSQVELTNIDGGTNSGLMKIAQVQHLLKEDAADQLESLSATGKQIGSSITISQL